MILLMERPTEEEIKEMEVEKVEQQPEEPKSFHSEYYGCMPSSDKLELD